MAKMNDIREWVDALVCDKKFEGISIYGISSRTSFGMPEVHVDTGIEKLATALNLDLVRSDWEGNKLCNSDWDELHFVYKGYKFFKLVPKE